MKYISLFTGIGGLEHRSIAPVMMCESDAASRQVLAHIYQGIEIWPDVRSFPKIKADVVAGGWPCQDITIAGRMRGLRGHRSGLFFEMVKVARSSSAHTVVGENVPNLIGSRRGQDFATVLNELHGLGYGWVAWRMIDSREFGLPQARRRLFFIASRSRRLALSLHRDVSDEWIGGDRARGSRRGPCYGFYWTGGERRSLCLSKGYLPALKVGSSTSKGTSPVGVFADGIVRKLTPAECLRVQGFSDVEPFEGHILGDVFRMAGNAVSRPVGEFVMAGAVGGIDAKPVIEMNPTDAVPECGVSNEGRMSRVVRLPRLAHRQLGGFLDRDVEPLSPQASAGLLTRVIRGRRWIPPEMFDALYRRSRKRTPLIGTRINSFEILDNEMRPLEFRSWLVDATTNAD